MISAGDETAGIQKQAGNSLRYSNSEAVIAIEGDVERIDLALDSNEAVVTEYVDVEALPKNLYAGSSKPYKNEGGWCNFADALVNLEDAKDIENPLLRYPAYAMTGYTAGVDLVLDAVETGSIAVDDFVYDRGVGQISAHLEGSARTAISLAERGVLYGTGLVGVNAALLAHPRTAPFVIGAANAMSKAITKAEAIDVAASFRTRNAQLLKFQGRHVLLPLGGFLFLAITELPSKLSTYVSEKVGKAFDLDEVGTIRVQHGTDLGMIVAGSALATVGYRKATYTLAGREPRIGNYWVTAGMLLGFAGGTVYAHNYGIQERIHSARVEQGLLPPEDTLGALELSEWDSDAFELHSTGALMMYLGAGAPLWAMFMYAPNAVATKILTRMGVKKAEAEGFRSLISGSSWFRVGFNTLAHFPVSMAVHRMQTYGMGLTSPEMRKATGGRGWVTIPTSYIAQNLGAGLFGSVTSMESYLVGMYFLNNSFEKCGIASQGLYKAVGQLINRYHAAKDPERRKELATQIVFYYMSAYDNGNASSKKNEKLKIRKLLDEKYKEEKIDFDIQVIEMGIIETQQHVASLGS